MVLASLRYWVQEMHVDGFRFDLAPALARDATTGDFDPDAPLLAEISSDPVLSRVKLVAEPWDVGPGGYRLGRFPSPWAEWNDRYRDAVRRFWRGDGDAAELAARIAGSRDLFAGRGPCSSVHYVTCHDGFTLRDLTSYEAKHNEANREGNRDGSDHNLSRNWGHEGPTDDPGVRAARARARRNLAATLLLSQGVPMLLGGDELGRTQRGNNNAYCQDGETSWLDWELDDGGRRFLAFVRRLLALRREHPGLRRETFGGIQAWLADGTGLGGAGAAGRGPRARALRVPAPEGGRDLLLLLNGSDADVAFRVPEAAGGWVGLLDTAEDGAADAGDLFRLPPYSLRLFRAAGTA